MDVSGRWSSAGWGVPIGEGQSKVEMVVGKGYAKLKSLFMVEMLKVMVKSVG